MAAITDLGARDEHGHLLGRPMIDTIHEGKRARAVGTEVVFRPITETKHEFFVSVLTNTLGSDWKAEQNKLGATARHPVGEWLDEWDEMRRPGSSKPRRKRSEGDGVYSADATGNLSSLVALSWDVYTLRHAMALSLDDAIAKRLGNRDQFQGARYEIAVAAVMVRAGYAIEWLTDTSRKLPEFIARDRKSGVEIAVEAKSRVRPGVLGKAGDRPSENELRADLGRLLRDALEKETDGRPLVVFLDLNMPPSGEPPTQEWVRKLHDEVMAPLGESSAANPDRFSVAVLTNFSWHWHGTEPSHGSATAVVVPLHPVVPLRSPDVDRVREAVQQYGWVPEG
jgi:hypothetical protein